jgi:putative hydrolases of HD superfamily
MKKIKSLLLELDKLKSVYRKSYLADTSRNENSAEHSWHLAMAIMSLKSWMPENINIDHAIKIALVHDICEIGAGDVCAYRENKNKNLKEKNYLVNLSFNYSNFGKEALHLWEEYENQETIESRWVMVVDKLLPFLLNIATHGKTWNEQNITKEMVLKHNNFIVNEAPVIHKWMLDEIDKAVNEGWLKDS